MRHSILVVFSLLLFTSTSLYGSISDPTRPIYSEKRNVALTNGSVVRKQQEILLQSIFFSENKRIAVVNGQIFQEGDRLDDIFVEKITKNNVDISYKKTRLTLVLSKKIYLDKLTGEISE